MPQPADSAPQSDEGRSTGGTTPLPGSAEGPRVGLWMGLLLLFVPVFYPLLFFKRYSWIARLGWGGWLGLIVFVKLAGLSEPVINLTEIQRELEHPATPTAEQAAPATATQPQSKGAAATFVQPDSAAPEPPPLGEYLDQLGGGVLGRHIVEHKAVGDAITIRFDAVDWYLDSEDTVALESIGAALSLFYGRDFRRMELYFDFHDKPLKVSLTREAFNAFFGVTEAQVRAMLATRETQERSPFAPGRILPEQQKAFFERFARYE